MIWHIIKNLSFDNILHIFQTSFIKTFSVFYNRETLWCKCPFNYKNIVSFLKKEKGKKVKQGKNARKKDAFFKGKILGN